MSQSIIQYVCVSLCVTGCTWRALIQKNTQGTQQWGLKGREENKSRYQGAKDEKKIERERE